MPVDFQLPSLTCVSTARSTTITMEDVATPDSVQSEAFVSVAALFLLFSASTKEEKAYMKLPSVWRDLWTEFLTERQSQIDRYDRETVKQLRDMLRQQQERDEEEGVILADGFKRRYRASEESSGVQTPERRVGDEAVQSQQSLQDLWQRKTSTPSYQRMLVLRSSLPIWQFKEATLSTIAENQITIICGETGCGKSTQMPAYILEQQLSQGRPCKIYCTEPRRISAISLAQRVSEELGEHRGDVGTSRSLVGYAIRLESHISAQTRLVYATVGIVLRMLESSNKLHDITHLIVDEVHERSIDTDFLLIVLRLLVKQRPALKVVLMSATVDAQRFSDYLGGAPVLNVPGRTFPVKQQFLEDAIELIGYTVDRGDPMQAQGEDEDTAEESSDASKSGLSQHLQGYSSRTRTTVTQWNEYRIDYQLIVDLIKKVSTDPEFKSYSKAILVFLPGIAEIRQLNDMLVGHGAFNKGWLVYPLHSTIASEEQQAAFVVPPPGTRKIVLATNIAETGITIPDVTCVIDTGVHKEMRYDERRQLSRLTQSFISRANAKQRRGRAGRVQEGLCFHLFTRYRHDKLMNEHQVPEMLRLSLQELVMRVKICKLGSIEQTLSDALDPPSSKNIRRAVDALIEVGALTSNEELTPLGEQLAKLPLDSILGKMILLGCIFSCLDVTLTAAAILSSKSPFVSPFGSRQAADGARLAFKKADSDLLTVYNAYSAWHRICSQSGGSEHQFCRRNFLSAQTLANIEDLKAQLLSSLVEAGFVVLDKGDRIVPPSRGQRFVTIPSQYNTNNEHEILVTSVIAWSFYPKLLVREGRGWRNVCNNQTVSLHPTSVNKGSANTRIKHLSFYHIMQSASKFTNAHETSPVPTPAIALLLGSTTTFNLYAGVFAIDGNRMKFAVKKWKTLVAIKMLRTRINEMVRARLRSPSRAVGKREEKWMEVWRRVMAASAAAVGVGVGVGVAAAEEVEVGRNR